MDHMPLWAPTHERIAQSNMTHFTTLAEQRTGITFANYDALWHWSIDDRANFWNLVWDYCHVLGEKGDGPVLAHGENMLASSWFTTSRLNYAENLLKFSQAKPDADAIIFWGENKVKIRLSHAQLLRQVAQFAAGLKSLGITRGDRVAGYLPNIPQTIVAMLATVSLGAIWTSASPDFGQQALLDRFGQIQPRVLVCTDGYWYNGKLIDCQEKNQLIASSLPSLCKTIVVPYLGKPISDMSIAHGEHWDAFLHQHVHATNIPFERVPFDHPLFIMYSSGTTGIPKCIVHGHGGTLLQLLKEHQLHGDIGEKSKLLFFTTCGWMMWNWQVSALASQSTLVLYDGSPTYLNGHILFDLIEAEKVTHFGTSAKFLDVLSKLEVRPNVSHDLSTLKVLFSTGSPLAPEGFDYVYQKIKQDILLASIAGGTDIISCFVLGNPNLPVYRGEVQCTGLAMAVDVFDHAGNSLVAEKGELVCTRSFPSQPIGFWGDVDKQKYKAAYFDRWPNVWCHGDFVERTEHNGIIMYGRSDATLNPGGVRIGTAEIYRQVETLDEVVESLVVGQDWHNDVRIILFVKLRDGVSFNEALTQKIKAHIKQHTTARHVPAKVIQVTDIPKTKNGKLVELAVRDMIHGRPVKNVDSLANPDVLDLFRNLVELNS